MTIGPASTGISEPTESACVIATTSALWPPELASNCGSKERELEAGGLNWPARHTSPS